MNSSGLLSHPDPSRSNHLFSYHITGFDFFRNCPFWVRIRLHLSYRLVHGRIEWLPYRFHSHRMPALESRPQLPVDGGHSVANRIRACSGFDRGKGPLEIVKYRKKVVYQLLCCKLSQLELLLSRATSEVLEIGESSKMLVVRLIPLEREESDQLFLFLDVRGIRWILAIIFNRFGLTLPRLLLLRIVSGGVVSLGQSYSPYRFKFYLGALERRRNL